MIEELLRDDYTVKQAEALQDKYVNLINQENDNIDSIYKIKLIAGVDISYYDREIFEYGIACAALWDLDQEALISHKFTQEIIKFPYQPGLLGFRECKLLSKAILTLPRKPDLIMCDGHGIIHPKRFGEAVQLGIALNIPSIGIAKNPFIGYSNWNEIERYKGSKTPVWESNQDKDPSNTMLGFAICLNDDSKPVFLSVGYKTKLESALEICLKTSKGHRQPEPLYLADKLSRERILKI